MDNPMSAAPKPKSNKVVWLVAAIVLIGAVVALNNISNSSDEFSSKDDSSDVVKETDEEAAIQASSAATLVVDNDMDLALPYTAAFTKYAGRRIAFDSRCQATPTTTTFQDGTKIMLDNRGVGASRIVVGNKAFQIPAYNFAFLTLATGIYEVDCESNKSAATITVTK
ncbi:MAG: hypothetical protein Q7R62_02060 [bacterium]|nr:hypothetical protein [bacterium]